MIRIEKTAVYGWRAALRGMRNPKNSWDNSDTQYYRTQPLFDYEDEDEESEYVMLGNNDYKLATTLANAGSEHGKFLRMINVTCDIVAPLYWWKEFDTYKVGTVADSCSTMHKIQAKEFTLNDFSHEHLEKLSIDSQEVAEADGASVLQFIIKFLNFYRDMFNKTKDKNYWWQMIQLLPSSYNQRRTIQFNYAVLRAMYKQRKDHKLDEWHSFCDWIKTLPYCELITGEQNES